MSLVKFSNRTIHRGKRIHWGRASEDAAPYRGAFAPSYTQDEHETKLVRVADPQAEVFDLADPEQKAAYLLVLDGCVNGWYQCLYRKRIFDRKNPKRAFMHIEWVEYFMEDGHPTPYMTPGMMELGNGNSALLPPQGQGVVG